MTIESSSLVNTYLEIHNKVEETKLLILANQLPNGANELKDPLSYIDR